jgi:uncharacterized glyoxalase superfamily protein PhnB
MAVQNPPQGVPAVAPYLLYEDLDSAVDWLVAAFGFVIEKRMSGPDGRGFHAELRHKGSLVMAGRPELEYKNPAHLGGVTQLVYVYVDDVDRHYEVAKAAGAKILKEPADQFYGDRTYNVEDPEGHHWSFAQRVREVTADEMRQAMG